MEIMKNPGIAIDHIRLIKSHVEMVAPDGKREFNLKLEGLGRFESKDGKELTLHAAFDVMHGVEKPLFKFTCEFIAKYVRREETSMDWKDFSSAMALAHIIPYLREYVSNITNRLPAPVLMLDPINTHAMIADFEERSRRVAASNTSGKPSVPADEG